MESRMSVLLLRYCVLRNSTWAEIPAVVPRVHRRTALHADIAALAGSAGRNCPRSQRFTGGTAYGGSLSTGLCADQAWRCGHGKIAAHDRHSMRGWCSWWNSSTAYIVGRYRAPPLSSPTDRAWPRRIQTPLLRPKKKTSSGARPPRNIGLEHCRQCLCPIIHLRAQSSASR